MRIRTSADLQQALNTLATDCVTAQIHWRLFRDLLSSVPRFAREIAQAQAFWSLTLASHRDVTLFRLGRLYDQHADAIALPTLLGAINANLHLFEERHFRERLKGNPFVDSLSKGVRAPDPSAVARDIRMVSKQNPVVSRLYWLRNKQLAHLDLGAVLRGRGPAASLTRRDVTFLLRRAHEIVNRYSILFQASSHLSKMIGQEDYQSVLRLVRRGLKSLDDAQRAELKKLGIAGAG